MEKAGFAIENLVAGQISPYYNTQQNRSERMGVVVEKRNCAKAQ